MEAHDSTLESEVSELLGMVGDHAVLTREEELAAFQRLEKGDQSARDQLVKCNLRFVVKLALQYRNMGIPLADLVQEGTIGLLQAIDRFEWQKGFRFTTYAAFWIRQEIQGAVRRNGSMLYLPIRKARLLGKISECMRTFTSREGREPSNIEISELLGVALDTIESLMPLRESVLSLDAEGGEEGGTLAETIPSTSDSSSPSARIEEVETAGAVRSVLGFLNEREKRVIELRFGFGSSSSRGMSLRKTSRVVGLSQEGVRRIEARAMDKLRRPAISNRVYGLMTA